MSSEKNTCRADSSRGRLSLEEQNGSWENEGWMVVKKESIGEYIKEAPIGAEALKNIANIHNHEREKGHRKEIFGNMWLKAERGAGSWTICAEEQVSHCGCRAHTAPFPGHCCWIPGLCMLNWKRWICWAHMGHVVFLILKLGFIGAGGDSEPGRSGCLSNRQCIICYLWSHFFSLEQARNSEVCWYQNQRNYLLTNLPWCVTFCGSLAALSSQLEVQNPHSLAQWYQGQGCASSSLKPIGLLARVLHLALQKFLARTLSVLLLPGNGFLHLRMTSLRCLGWSGLSALLQETPVLLTLFFPGL